MTYSVHKLVNSEPFLPFLFGLPIGTLTIAVSAI